MFLILSWEFYTAKCMISTNLFYTRFSMLDNILGKMKDQLNLNEMWKQNSSKVENLVIDGLLGLTEDKLINETEIRAVIAKVYELLPTPIR